MMDFAMFLSFGVKLYVDRPSMKIMRAVIA